MRPQPFEIFQYNNDEFFRILYLTIIYFLIRIGVAKTLAIPKLRSSFRARLPVTSARVLNCRNFRKGGLCDGRNGEFLMARQPEMFVKPRLFKKTAVIFLEWFTKLW